MRHSTPVTDYSITLSDLHSFEQTNCIILLIIFKSFLISRVAYTTPNIRLGIQNLMC